MWPTETQNSTFQGPDSYSDDEVVKSCHKIMADFKTSDEIARRHGVLRLVQMAEELCANSTNQALQTNQILDESNLLQHSLKTCLSWMTEKELGDLIQEDYEGPNLARRLVEIKKTDRIRGAPKLWSSMADIIKSLAKPDGSRTENAKVSNFCPGTAQREYAYEPLVPAEHTATDENPLFGIPTRQPEVNSLTQTSSNQDNDANDQDGLYGPGLGFSYPYGL
jgi:hypothetical protein